MTSGARWKPFVLRLYRAALLIAVVFLIRGQREWLEAKHDRFGRAITVAQAQELLPETRQVQLLDTERGVSGALDSDGNRIGLLLATSPFTDDIIGYSGPNNILVALDGEGKVAGLRLLRSGDTEEHVELVLRHPEFLKSFVGWMPPSPAPAIEGVSGATLTSYAIAESVQRRLLGSAPSMRFPEPVTLDEARRLFPQTARLTREGRCLKVFDAENRPLGCILRTSPETDNVSGYRGPTEAFVGLDTNAQKIVAVRLERSYDNPSYVDQVREDEYFMNLFLGRTVEEMAALDYELEGIEGVSGATRTSYAMTEGMKRRFASEANARLAAKRPWLKPRDWATAAVVVGAMIMAFTRLRGRRAVRVVWQVLLVGYVGVISGDLLSLDLLGGWAANGIAHGNAPGLVLLAAAALLLPWATRRQVYCHHICPHGVVQQWLRILRRNVRWKRLEGTGNSGPLLRREVFVALKWLPGLLLATALLSLVAGVPLRLVNLEPFDAWIWRAAGVVPIAIAVVGLTASLFIPMAYCRYGCPTGALLNFVRSSGSADRWGRRDTLALVLFLAGAAFAGYARA